MSQSKSQSLKERVLKSIDKIRPYLLTDGGDIELVDIQYESIVNIRLIGACRDCEYSHQTMAGVTEAIKKDSSEILQVNLVS
ncbi:MAG: NifU family protein [Bacteroidota bacterium]|nr:NifU family protein [Bacteroidota bacterium]